MTILSLAIGSLFCGFLLFFAEHYDESATLPLFLFGLFGFVGLFSDFRHLKTHQHEIARQQRELILQATLFTMADTTDSLRQDLSQLYQNAENGCLPDTESLKNLQELLETHISRLQQLGNMAIYSEARVPVRNTYPGSH